MVMIRGVFIGTDNVIGIVCAALIGWTVPGLAEETRLDAMTKTFSIGFLVSGTLLNTSSGTPSACIPAVKKLCICMPEAPQIGVGVDIHIHIHVIHQRRWIERCAMMFLRGSSRSLVTHIAYSRRPTRAFPSPLDSYPLPGPTDPSLAHPTDALPINSSTTLHLNLSHRNHLLPQIILILSNRAVPSPNRLVLAHHDILGNFVKKSSTPSVNELEI